MFNPSALRLLVIVMLIFVPPLFFGGDTGNRAGFDASHRRNLAANSPDHVFIGSSLLLSRMDTRHFSEMTGGQSGYILGDVASMSALWFLWLKNSLIPSAIKPKTVFLFFRRTDLTDPIYGTESLFVREKIRANSIGEEPVIERVFAANKDFISRFGEWLLKLYPIQETWQKRGKWFMDSAGYFFMLPGYADYKWRSIIAPETVTRAERVKMMRLRAEFSRDMATKVFADNNLRIQNERYVKPVVYKGRYDFARRLPLSFLPDIVRLAKEADLNLVLVQMQSRPNRDGSITGGVATERYTADLAAYAEQNGVLLYDFTGDSEITWSMYQDGGHIAAEYKRTWTEIFVKRLGEHLR